MSAKDGMTSNKILALIEEGKKRRENPVAQPPIAAPEPTVVEAVVKPAVPAAPPVNANPLPVEQTPAPQAQERPMEDLQEEPPAEVPVLLDSSSGLLPRKRRVGLRSDPAWAQKTVFLRRATIAEAEIVANALGVEFSELVEWALSLQVKDEMRNAGLKALLGQRS